MLQVQRIRPNVKELERATRKELENPSQVNETKKEESIRQREEIEERVSAKMRNHAAEFMRDGLYQHDTMTNLMLQLLRHQIDPSDGWLMKHVKWHTVNLLVWMWPIYQVIQTAHHVLI